MAIGRPQYSDRPAGRPHWSSGIPARARATMPAESPGEGILTCSWINLVDSKERGTYLRRRTTERQRHFGRELNKEGKERGQCGRKNGFLDVFCANSGLQRAGHQRCRGYVWPVCTG